MEREEREEREEVEVVIEDGDGDGEGDGDWEDGDSWSLGSGDEEEEEVAVEKKVPLGPATNKQNNKPSTTQSLKPKPTPTNPSLAFKKSTQTPAQSTPQSRPQKPRP